MIRKYSLALPINQSSLRKGESPSNGIQWRFITVISPDIFAKAGLSLGRVLFFCLRCWAWTLTLGWGKEEMYTNWERGGTTRICVCQWLAPTLVSPWLQTCNLTFVADWQGERGLLLQTHSHAWSGFGEGKGREPRGTGASGQEAAPHHQPESGATMGPDPYVHLPGVTMAIVLWPLKFSTDFSSGQPQPEIFSEEDSGKHLAKLTHYKSQNSLNLERG